MTFTPVAGTNDAPYISLGIDESRLRISNGLLDVTPNAQWGRATNTDHQSSDNQSRLHFEHNSTTWIKGIGRDPDYITHKFVNESNQPILTLTSARSLGIGMDGNPGTRLQVASANINSGTQNMAYFKQSYSYLISGDYEVDITDVCAIFGSSIWVYSWIASSSDERIKKNIEDINDDSALQKILSIQPKTYNYIDVVNKGNRRVYGFIAQQIKEVLPEAVTLQKEVIPNIYKVCACSLNKIYINIDASIDTKIDIVKLDGNRTQYTITGIEEDHITIDKELEGDKCFVYGIQVEDFHTISKDYIFTLNVCATQVLSQKVDDLQVKLDQQQELLNNLTSRIIQLEGS